MKIKTLIKTIASEELEKQIEKEINNDEDDGRPIEDLIKGDETSSSEV